MQLKIRKGSKFMSTKLNMMAVLSLLAWVSNAGAATHPYKYLPGLVPVLGQGFMPDNPLALPAPCMTGMGTISNPSQNVNQSAPLDEKVVTTSSALKFVLGIDTQMDASVLVYSGSADLNINTEYDEVDNGVSVVIQGQANYGNEVLDMSKMVYRSDIQKLVDQGRVQEFHKACGDEMVTTLNKGTSVSVVITMHGVDRAFKETLTDNASASGGFGPLSASAKMQLNQMLITQSGYSELTVNVFVRGGNGLPDFAGIVASLQSTGKSWDQLEQGVAEIFKDLTPEKAAITGFVTETYPGVSDQNENLILDEKTRDLENLVSMYRYHLQQQELLEGLFQKEEQTGVAPREFSNLTDAVLDGAKQDLPVLDAYVSKLAQVHQNCLAEQSPQLDACRIPPMPQMFGVILMYDLLSL
jgi:hypothetical protein